ncbi:SRSF7-like protein [Mya arenaria]|uniref:SRSF7-like protein n=1 Tax=Mya arenaria TaxID=6604 RepID=A0ABY7E0U0_MYAAR|nr:SRSF7-like protein [Mya arenaria]
MSRGGRDLDCKIYVGDLARDTNEKDIERAFSYYGRLRSVWVARNPAGFAFVEYEDPRDADDAVRGLDGTSINGVRVRVENSTGKVRPKPWLRGGGGGGGGRSGGRPGGGRRPFHPDDRCYECGESGHYAYDCPRYKSRGRRHSRPSNDISYDQLEMTTVSTSSLSDKHPCDSIFTSCRSPLTPNRTQNDNKRVLIIRGV